MNINSIITIVIYCLFFLSLITGALWGLKRGLKKSSLRIGLLIVFLIIAGFIVSPISKALLTINLSSFNLNINGSVVTTIPELVRTSLLSIGGFQEVAESMPSVMTFVNGLPVAIMNIIVFLILIFVMQFLSWIVFAILAKTTLKESKIEKQIKKQKKLEKKSKDASKNNQKINSIPLAPPKKRRLLGCLVGTVQGFILIFLVLMPITSLCGTIGEISGTNIPSETNSLIIYAEEESDSLSEYSSDLLKNILGNEVVSYFTTLNNAVPTKILSVFGLNNSIFDSLTTINVNGQGIAFRKDAVSASKIYNKYIEVMEQVGENQSWSELNFNSVRDALDILFDTGLFKAFAEEGISYGLDKVSSMGTFSTMSYGTDIQEGLELLVSSYQTDSKGFIKSFEKDFNSLINVCESVFESGLFDKIMIDHANYNGFVDSLKTKNYKLLSDITNNGYDSYIFKVLTSKGLNIALNLGSTALSKDGTLVNLGTTDYDSINWTSLKPSIFNTLKNVIDVYDIISLYGLNTFIENPRSVLNDISSVDIKDLMSILGKELDLFQDSPLFEGQSNTPVKGLITWGGLKLPDYLDTTAMLAITSWQTELENLSTSLTGLKESGVLSLLLDSSSTLNTEDIINLLLDPVSADLNANTYIKEVLTPILNSSLTKKLIIYGLNKANSAISNSIPELTLTEFTTNDLTEDQNPDISNIVENIAKCFSILAGDSELDLETVDVSKLASLFSSLQRNAFRIGAGAGIEKMNSNVNLTSKTVTGGGIFANYYVSIVTYVLGNNIGINLKTVNWTSFFESAKGLSGNFDSIGENGSISDFLDLSNSESQEDLSNLLNSLGLGGDEDGNGINDLVEDFSALQTAITGLEEGTIPNEEVYQMISDAITAILENADEEGNTTIDTLVNMIKTMTGDDTISDQISSAVITNEQTVTSRINTLLINQTATGVGLTAGNLAESIADLTCGATFVLQKAVDNGTVITYNVDTTTLTNAINEAEASQTVKDLVLNLFGITP